LKLHPVKIHIKDFQSIDDLEIEVHGFTCITGPSNIGKSAIVRATSSAILNNPVVGMVRKGSSFCTVEMTSDEWGFKWEKNDKGVNRVWFPDRDKPLDKLGQVQVKEVSAMGFGSIEVGEDEIQPWFAPQFQAKGCGPLFLLDQSGPRVTDFLSEVSRLTVLQDAIVLAARGKRSATDQAKLKNEEAGNIKTKLAKVGALDTLEKLGRDLEEQAASIEEYEERIERGEALVAKRQDAERVIGLLEKLEGFKIPRDNCGEPVKKLQGLFQMCFQLELCATRVRDIRDVSKIKIPEDLTPELDKLREVQKFARLEPLRQSVKLLEDLPKVKIPDVKKLRVEVDHMNRVAKFATQIGALSASVALLDTPVTLPEDIDEIEQLQKISTYAQQTQTLLDEISSMEAELKKIDRELSSVEMQIASIPACPTCRRPWSPDHTAKHKKLSA
jgi:hypothetical protein